MTFLVNGEKAETETIIRDNDLICHLVHRHEPPVTSTELAILHEDDDLVVVNKPASIPVEMKALGHYYNPNCSFLLFRFIPVGDIVTTQSSSCWQRNTT